MPFTGKQTWLVLLLAIIVMLATSACSSGPSAPKMGTPAFYWQAAGETFAKADYLKTADHLEKLTKTDNEFTERAIPWRLIVTAGMTHGYMELADAAETGARMNRAKPTPFRTLTAESRALAGQRALQYAEVFLKFAKRDPAQPIPLDFSFPSGSASTPPDLNRLGNGIMLSEVQIENLRKRLIEQEIVLSVCKGVGATDDVAKAQSGFQAGNVKIPHDVFALAAATHMQEIADLFSRKKLDQPERLELFCNEAADAIKSIKPSKETKALTAKIEKTLKEAKKKD